MWPFDGGIEDVEVKGIYELLVVGFDHLHVKRPFREIPLLDVVKKVAAGEAEMLLDSLVVVQTLHSLAGFPGVPHEGLLALGVDPLEGVHAPTVQFSVGGWDAHVY